MATPKTALQKIQERKAAYEKEVAELRETAGKELLAQIDAKNVEIVEKQNELTALQTEYEEVTGISLKPKSESGSKKGKKKTASKDEGKSVSIATLTKHLNGIKGKGDEEHRSRNIATVLETTSNQVLATANAHKDAFVVTGKSPWYIVNLK